MRNINEMSLKDVVRFMSDCYKIGYPLIFSGLGNGKVRLKSDVEN